MRNLLIALFLCLAYCACTILLGYYYTIPAEHNTIYYAQHPNNNTILYAHLPNGIIYAQNTNANGNP
jgi:hypothetical protein